MSFGHSGHALVASSSAKAMTDVITSPGGHAGHTPSVGGIRHAHESVSVDTSGGGRGSSKYDNEATGSGSYLPPEALSPWSDIITKYLNGTAPSQKHYWRAKRHRRREHRSKSSGGERKMTFRVTFTKR